MRAVSVGGRSHFPGSVAAAGTSCFDRLNTTSSVMVHLPSEVLAGNLPKDAGGQPAPPIHHRGD